jgi:hypothetical protein
MHLSRAYNLTVPQGKLLTNPILEQLCLSFYEEEKWQWVLMVHFRTDNEWTTTVTTTMVAFATTTMSTSWVGDLMF